MSAAPSLYRKLFLGWLLFSPQIEFITNYSFKRISPIGEKFDSIVRHKAILARDLDKTVIASPMRFKKAD